MKKKQLTIGILAILLLLVFIYVLLVSALSWWQSLNTTVAASLITAILGLLGLWYSQWQSKSRDIAESHRSSKIEVYSTFFDIFDKFHADAVSADELHEENLPGWLREDFAKLNRGLILWASPAVITAWLNFRGVSSSGGNILLAMDEMYKAIRKDLSNSNFGLKSGDLIRLGLRDPEELKL